MSAAPAGPAVQFAPAAGVEGCCTNSRTASRAATNSIGASSGSYWTPLHRIWPFCRLCRGLRPDILRERPHQATSTPLLVNVRTPSNDARSGKCWGEGVSCYSRGFKKYGGVELDVGAKVSRGIALGKK